MPEKNILINSVPRRCNSTLDMLEKFTELNGSSHALAQGKDFNNTDLRPMVYNLYGQAIMQGMFFFTLFRKVTELLSGENRPTLPMLSNHYIKVFKKKTQREKKRMNKGHKTIRKLQKNIERNYTKDFQAWGFMKRPQWLTQG